MGLEFIDKLPSLREVNLVASALSSRVTNDNLPRPFLMTVVVTRRCNSRCKMCNIWQEKSPPELSLDQYRQIFRDPFPFVRVLTLTGGEPTLRADLPEIFEIVRAACPNLEHVELATSGLNVKRTLAQVQTMLQSVEDRPDRIRKFNVQISLDGLDDMHDEIRGIDGFFKKVETVFEGLSVLQQRYPFLGVKISSVVMPQNLPDADRVHAYAVEHHWPIHFSPIVVSGEYYANTHGSNDLIFVSGSGETHEAEDFFNRLANDAPASMRFYYREMAKMLGGATRSRRCMMGFYGFILEANGHVYPCVNCEQYSFGNLLEQSFDDVWFSTSAGDGRKNLRQTCCPTCVSMCYTLPANVPELLSAVKQKALGN